MALHIGGVVRPPELSQTMANTKDPLRTNSSGGGLAPWLDEGGEAGAQMEAMDWASSHLGPLQTWPQSLRSVVSICLGSRFPMVVLWGPELVMLYNDAYAPLLGDKHPAAMGRRIAEVWSEIADVIAPLMDSVMQTGKATWIPDGYLALERHGAPEETYFAYSFGPIRIEDGSIGGILGVTMETTQSVVSERRLSFLRTLSDATAGSENASDVCARLMSSIGAGTQDILQAAISLDHQDAGKPLTAQSLSASSDLTAPDNQHAIAVEIQAGEGTDRLGTLLVKPNPLRPLDDEYLEFFAAIGRHIARSLGDVKVLEAERARLHAERELRRMFEQAPSFVCIMQGPDHVFEFVNRAHLAIFNSAAWIGKPAREAFPDIADQGYFEQLDAVYRTGVRYVAASAPVRYRFSPDEPEDLRLLDFIYEPIRDESGRVTGVFCEGFDVTPQRRAEAALRDQEERLRAFINSTSNVLYTMSPDWSVMRTLDGRGSLGESRVVHHSWLTDSIHEDDRELVAAAVRDAVDGKCTFESEHRVRTADGAFGWTFSRAVPIMDAAGSVIEWFGAASDITPRKKMEADLASARHQNEEQRRLYEAILTNTPDLAYVFDLSHRFIYANDVLLRMWGTTREQALGKTCLELGYEPWHAEMHDREIDQVAATKLPVRGEVPFAGTFGRRIYDYILVPVFGPSGDVVAVAGTTRDITEIKEMEETLRSQAALLVESDRRKDEFLGILAHELRNPLAPLKNGLEVIRRLALNDTATLHRLRDMMDRQVSQMVRLIDDLLDVTRISSGKIRIAKDRLALEDVIKAAVETSQPAIEKPGHALTITAPSRPVFIDGDATRLAQVFSNLLTNAAKFTPAGGHIWITTERIDGDVAVTVRDDGEGIPADMLTSIFDMFVQVDRSIECDKSGVGIGLCLARGLVALHGGNIEAHSDGPGKGSEFVVRIPIAVESNLPTNALSAEPDADSLTYRRVLIADDNVDAAESLAILLGLMGSETRVVHNGLDAIEEAARFRPELVLLDIGMPRLNGYEACARIKATPWGREMVVVALTGWGQEKDRMTSREAGFDVHLVKPVNPDAIKSLVKQLTL